MKLFWQSPQTRNGKSAKLLGRRPGTQGELDVYTLPVNCMTLTIKTNWMNTVLPLSADLMITTTTHHHACHHQAEEGVVVAEGVMPTRQITMVMKTTMTITMATTIMTTAAAMKTLIMAMKMCTA